MGLSHWTARGMALVALLAASATGHTEVFSDRCNSCTLQQKADVARQLAPQGGLPNTPHQAYIVDYDAETLTRFNLMVVHEPWDGLSYTVATVAPVPADIQQQFAIDIAALKAFAQTFEDITRAIPPGVTPSAFDYMADSGVRTRTHAWVSDSLGFLERGAVYFAGFVKILKITIRLVLKVRFSDGSTAHLEFLGEVDGTMWWPRTPRATTYRR